MRLASLLLVVLILLLQYRLWFGKNSVADYNHLQKLIVKQQKENNQLTQRNKILYADIDDLKAGQEAIEERARNELGMIKDGETFFRVIPDQKDIKNKGSFE